MTDYMLTAWSTSLGWRDIAVYGASSILQAIRLAENASGCRVSHGRGGVIGSAFDPGLVIDAETGEVEQRHERAAKPVVETGPPDVVRAIQAAMAPARARRD